MTAKKRHAKKKPVSHKPVIKEKSWKDNVFFYAIGMFVLLIVLLQFFIY